MVQIIFGKVNRPVAESKYIVRVQAKEVNWRTFLYFSGMPILPAHVLKDVNGDAYLKNYNYKLLPGTGPYTIQESDIHKGQSITVRRRKDYWAAKARANVGLNNFDELNFTVVRDENLIFEKLKKGELDISYINIAAAVGGRDGFRQRPARTHSKAKDIQQSRGKLRRICASTPAKRRWTIFASAKL